MRFCSLASSSTHGNAFLVESAGGSRLLVDCGLPLRRLERCLAEAGVKPRDLQAILVSHDHLDHVRALLLRVPFADRHGVPVYTTARIWEEGYWGKRMVDPSLRRLLVPGQGVRIGDLLVETFVTPHDAVESIGFVLRDRTAAGEQSLAVVTDLGHVPPHLAEQVQGATALVLESNHDVELERAAARPWPVKDRVLGDYGHLSNQQAAQALPALVTAATRVVLLAHLSLQCNSPELALGEARTALNSIGWQGELAVAPADCPSPFFALGAATASPPLASAAPRRRSAVRQRQGMLPLD